MLLLIFTEGVAAPPTPPPTPVPCDVQALVSAGSCFFCLPPGYFYPVKLAMLSQLAAALNPTLDLSVNAIMARAKCFECLPPGEWPMLKLSLLCALSQSLAPSGPAAPTSLDITGASTNGNTILTWSQASAPDSNEVWRSINGAAFALKATIAGGLTTYTDTDAFVAGDQRTYKVRGVTGGVDGTFSDTISALFDVLINATGATSISYPDVAVIYGSVRGLVITNNASLLSVSLPVLHHAKFQLAAHGNNVLTSFTCPNLIQVGIFQEADPNLASMTLNNLQTASVIDLQTSKITTLSLPALTNVTNTLAVSDCSLLTSISAPILTNISNDFLASNTPVLASISLPNLATVGNLFTVGNTGLTTLSLPACTSIGLSITVTGTALTSVSLPVLTSLGADVNSSGSASLVTWSAPNVVFVDGNNIDISACALNALSVNTVLDRGVTSGLTSSTIVLDLGTNSPPTVGPPDGIAAKTTLITNGCSVTTN